MISIVVNLKLVLENMETWRTHLNFSSLFFADTLSDDDDGKKLNAGAMSCYCIITLRSTKIKTMFAGCFYSHYDYLFPSLNAVYEEKGTC